MLLQHDGKLHLHLGIKVELLGEISGQVLCLVSIVDDNALASRVSKVNIYVEHGLPSV